MSNIHFEPKFIVVGGASVRAPAHPFQRESSTEGRAGAARRGGYQPATNVGLLIAANRTPVAQGAMTQAGIKPSPSHLFARGSQYLPAPFFSPVSSLKCLAPGVAFGEQGAARTFTHRAHRRIRFDIASQSEAIQRATRTSMRSTARLAHSISSREACLFMADYSKPLTKFNAQRLQAKYRGIEWLLSQ